MDDILKNAYAEVYQILNILGNEYKRKVPSKLRKQFKENRNTNHKIDKQLNNVSRTALIIISVLNLKYWEKDSQKLAELRKKYNNNEIEYQQKINVYKKDGWLKRNKAQEIVEEVSLQEVKPSVIEKIAIFFKKIFHFERKSNKWK